MTASMQASQLSSVWVEETLNALSCPKLGLNSGQCPLNCVKLPLGNGLCFWVMCLSGTHHSHSIQSGMLSTEQLSGSSKAMMSTAVGRCMPEDRLSRLPGTKQVQLPNNIYI